MSIVHSVKDKLPEEGDLVYCDNGEHSSDRAVFKDGKFIGGDDWPILPYEMTCVENWFDLEEYRFCKNESSYFISFKEAKLMQLSHNYKRKEEQILEGRLVVEYTNNAGDKEECKIIKFVPDLAGGFNAVIELLDGTVKTVGMGQTQVAYK